MSSAFSLLPHPQIPIEFPTHFFSPYPLRQSVVMSVETVTEESTGSTSWATIHDFVKNNGKSSTDCLHQTQWDELCQIATSIAGQECKVLDQVARGLNNLVRLIQFADGTCWAARVHIQRKASSIATATRLESEIATMQFIKENCKLPVARIFAYDVNENKNNPVRAPYILMELIPGSVAIDALGGYDVHRGVIPKDRRKTFYRSVAKCHVRPAFCPYRFAWV